MSQDDEDDRRDRVYSFIAPSFSSSARRKPFRRRNSPAWTRPTEKYWLDLPKPRDQKWARWIVLIGMGMGAVAMFGVIALRYLMSNRATYTLILQDNFDHLNTETWVYEQQLGGYIEGSFDWTTTSSENSWVKDNLLHITPTLSQAYENGTIIDLTESKACTSTFAINCVAVQNTSAYSIIPPIQTARLSSRRTITYGRVEVVAKMPVGDWIWPTISLEPDSPVYGQFPASGGITIAQSRGNSPSFVSGGTNKVDTMVHFGADGHPYTDQVAMTRNTIQLGLVDFSNSYHTFGLEWTPKYIRTWLDYPSNTMLKVTWPQGFWRKANYGRFTNDYHWNRLTDPWTNGTLSAPYDVPFHLTLRNNVGAINGIFADTPAKPWFDQSGRGASMISFNTNRTWLDSWGDVEQRSLKIKSVKMWQQNGVK